MRQSRFSEEQIIGLLREQEIHPGASHWVTHPARQLAQSPRLVLDQDDVEAPTACALTNAKPSAEQRVPGVLDGRECRFVCGMTADLAT